jgi:hypothetical protein
VIFAIGLGGRREAEQIRNLRNGGEGPQTACQAVAVADELTTGGGGRVGKKRRDGLRPLRQRAFGPIRPQAVLRAERFGRLPAAREQALIVQRIDHDVSAQAGVGQAAELPFHAVGDEAGRYDEQNAGSRRGGQMADDGREHVKHVGGLMPELVPGGRGGVLRLCFGDLNGD